MDYTPPSKSEIKKYSKNAIETISLILQKFGPREPGSTAETKTQEFFAEELKKIASKVEVQHFTVAPLGLLFFLPLTGVILFFSSAVIYRYPILALFATIISLVIAYLQFGRYKKILDIFLPKKQSRNVIATLAPSSGIVRQRMIICGHADSAYEMRFNRWGTIYIRVATLLIFATALLVFLFSILSTTEYIFRVEILFAPIWVRKYIFILGCIYGILALGFIDFTKVVPGANDNLSGSVAVIEAFRWFANHPLELQNTELICLITGSEEAGLRGAYAYANENYQRLRETPTAVIAVDTLGDFDELGVVVRDMNGFIPHHKKVISLLYQAGLECGIQLKPVTVFLGSTDATAFSKKKIPASALVAMDPSPATYYHTRRDNLDSVNEDTINAGIRILIQTVRKFDLNGLPENGPLPIRKAKEAIHTPEHLPAN